MSELRESFTIRNLARDPSSKVARKLRPGNYTGFMLQDGRRIRRAGVRGAEVSFVDALKSIEQILAGVKYREIEVIAPDGSVATYEQLASWGRHRAGHRQALLDDDPKNDPSNQDVDPSKTDNTIPVASKFTVMLLSVTGEDKIKVIRELREATGLELGAVTALVDGVPKPVKEGLPMAEAAVLVDALQKAGATVELVEALLPKDEEHVATADLPADPQPPPPPPPPPPPVAVGEAKKQPSKKGSR